MKRRKGYVANSSSASYIVNIYLDVESIYKDMIGQMGYSYLNVDKIIKDMTKENEKLKIQLEKDKENDKGDKLLSFFNTRLEEDIESDSKFVEGLKERKDNKIEAVKFLLTEYYKISIEEKDDNVEFIYFTSMHNNYTENMTFILQEMIMYYLMETDVKVKCRIEEHD